MLIRLRRSLLFAYGINKVLIRLRRSLLFAYGINRFSHDLAHLQVLYYIWATTRQNVSSGVSDQARHKPACAATEASYSLEFSAIESRDIILSKQRTTEALIRLRGCAGWSAPLLFSYDIRHIFSWPGSYLFHCHSVFMCNWRKTLFERPSLRQECSNV